MFRTLVWFMYFMGSLVKSLPKLSKINKMESKGLIEESQKRSFIIVKEWCDKLIRLAGVEVEIIGEENIPKEGPVLFVSNHQSNFDIPILLAKIDKPKAFIAKIELKKFPVVNRWMQKINCIFMDRSDIRQSAKSIIKGIKLLKSGYSIVVFPEGTRSEDGNLLEFKAGALKLAIKSGVPIVPIIINGSKEIMPKGSKTIRSSKVKLIIEKPILNDEYKTLDTFEITNNLKSIIENKLSI
ncbi:lysophospholipid acyltransferase family protein [Helicovermis profundi]|uniref:1-acyl-sn-glycerol-3-phosphate acyltransferase n=1 Tax=Helicovermis profundi TaxID=3065157 RepID=A0AAU9ED65_9FIRM|nr:lysophospholipid acyltransferase family protein [Clostridia bacterium S502]